MKLIKNFKSKALILKKEITAIYYAYQNPDIKFSAKIIILLTLGYALSPIDLIPDFIPVLGYLDDLVILPLLIYLAIKLIPEDIMESARIKAENEPPRLKKNYISALMIIMIWIFIISVIIFETAVFKKN